MKNLFWIDRIIFWNTTKLIEVEFKLENRPWNRCGMQLHETIVIHPCTSLTIWKWFCDIAFVDATLQWHHNEHKGVSNHRSINCLLNRLFQAQIKANIKAPQHLSPRIHRWLVESIWWHHHDVNGDFENLIWRWYFAHFKIKFSKKVSPWNYSSRIIEQLTLQHPAANCEIML